MSLDKIGALEERFAQVAEMVRGLKQEKSRLEGELAGLRQELEYKKALEEELDKMTKEKEAVRARLEGLLKGMEELSGQ
jgi:chromosome segregation ATPase